MGSDCVSPFSQPTTEGEKLRQLRQEPAKRLKSAQVFKEQTAWQEAPRLAPRSWEAARDYAALAGSKLVTPNVAIGEHLPLHVLNIASRVGKNKPPQLELIHKFMAVIPAWNKLPFEEWRAKVLADLEGKGDGCLNGRFSATATSLKQWLKSFKLSDVHNTDTSSLLERSSRRELYASIVSDAINTTTDTPGRYATDGSHRRVTGGGSSTTAAVVGSGEGAVKLSTTQFTSPGHGEILAIIAALKHRRKNPPPDGEVEIITDSKNTITASHEALRRGPASVGHTHKSRPASDVMRWLWAEVEKVQLSDVTLKLTLVRSHTPITMNDSVS